MPANFQRLFRFMSVRPVQGGENAEKFIQYSRKKDSEFVQALQRAANVQAATGLAKSIVDKSDYFSTRNPRASEFGPLIIGMQVIYKNIFDSDLDAIRQYINDELARTGNENTLAALVKREAEIWDHYFASLLLPSVSEAQRAGLVDALRGVSVGPMLPSITDKKPLLLAAGAIPVLPDWLSKFLVKAQKKFPFVAGVGDLMIVKEQWKQYERGEIAHVENVMATETRSRTHRQLDSTSTTTTFETEVTEETSKETETSTHNSLQMEIESSLSQETNVSTGVTASASFGPAVSVDTSASFDFSTASEESRRSSEEYAQDVVEKAVSKVATRERSETVTVVLSEAEETNLHSFINDADDAKNITGVYRYLNQLWEAQVFNYGKRLMLDIVIPEPSINWRQSRKVGIDFALTLTPPKSINFDASTLTPTTYQAKAKDYGATNVPAPPDTFHYITKVIEIDPSKRGTADVSSVATGSDQVAVPEGYGAIEATVAFESTSWKNDKKDRTAKVLIAGRERNIDDNQPTFILDNLVGPVEIGVYLDQMQGCIVTVQIKCEILSEAWADWQNAVFDAISQAQSEDMQAYEAELKSMETTRALSQEYFSPDAKRTIEQNELKRSAIATISEQNFEQAGAIEFSGSALTMNYPLINFTDAKTKGSIARFFEEAFEWEEMTYLYYPYFWARRETWWELMAETDPDVLFESFLRAGAARVNLSVRPGFETAVLYYFATSEIWRGGPAPVIGDPLYVSLIDEIVQSKGLSLDNPKAIGESWTYTMPTKFVVLDPDDRIIPPPEAPSQN